MTGHAFLKLVLLIILLVTGGMAVFLRRDEESISRYTVVKAEPRDRMLAAIIPRDQQAWFFKLTGPREAVAEQASAFRELIQSVNFDSGPAGQPTWTLPPGWKQRPGSEMRFATLQVESDDTLLECSVSMLPMLSPDVTAYVLANVNRWRDQMRLPKLAQSELPSATSQVKLSGSGLTATLVDLEGNLAGSQMGPAGAAPFAAGAASGARSTPSGTRSDEKLSFDVPEGWQQGELEIARGGISVRRAAAFEVRDGDQRVEITVTKLPPGGMLANFNRWRGQIGLEPMTAEQFSETKQQIDFAGSPADYVRFTGPEQTILGVIAVRGDAAWFVKLQGPNDLAGRERKNFEAFVKSIRF